MTRARKFENPEPAIHHALALWAANCAEHVLNLFETNYPDDKRPRLAIAALREWADGKRTMVSCREAASEAWTQERRWQHKHLQNNLQPIGFPKGE